MTLTYLGCCYILKSLPLQAKLKGISLSKNRNYTSVASGNPSEQVDETAAVDEPVVVVAASDSSAEVAAVEAIKPAAPPAVQPPEGMRMLRSLRFPMHDGSQNVTFVDTAARAGVVTNWVKSQLDAGLLVDETAEVEAVAE